MPRQNILSSLTGLDRAVERSVPALKRWAIVGFPGASAIAIVLVASRKLAVRIDFSAEALG